ncbi:MAG: aromatic amino acid hydroxylase [Bacteroidales bacterium]|nr:aromatic amino acid hydroxylase [Bacteroidales bacterium]MDD3131910.1 aromatic amino acid hydroxylase [Bacteroidales bacterium]MDD4740869.1 aromatic amino acid hydroxylase [Bacteroidales bacterium]NLO52664.1 aromatic amino acid hydroxylase [Bacteroidales bacterium]
METNHVLDKLPRHLLKLVIDQPYNSYTPQDQAVWRYVMRQNVKYLSRVAHGSYLEGLRKTGISINEIPHMYGMNRILKEIGWAAVAVDGFIPPAAFMEFQAYNVLVIAADIRPIDQIDYTPAPDIIHEAAGHAPIIADADYAEHLRLFGEIGAKALSSANDYKQYEAIRHLSILKADPYSSREEIQRAEQKLEVINANLGEPSEMALIRNLHWWTVEYGLIGELENPKIYGAGLLSSIGESFSCLQPEVKKLPYTLEAVKTNFDITTRQPQLFVTPDFAHLTTVLNEFADTMAQRSGGTQGLQKAVKSAHLATAVYASGLQISGTFSKIITKQQQAIYLQTSSPTQLCYADDQLAGHDKSNHKDGFGSPIGNFKNSHTPPENLDADQLEALSLREGEYCQIEFASGVEVAGKLRNILRREGRNLVFSFEECTVRYQDQVLFEPQWGIYDMAVGSKIVSVFSGAADPEAYQMEFAPPEEKTHKIIHSDAARRLHSLYRVVRDVRQQKQSQDALPDIWHTLQQEFPDEWLLPLEILEIATANNSSDHLRKAITSYLFELQKRKPGLAGLIDNGLRLIDEMTPAR